MYLGAKMEDEKEKEAQIVVKEEEEGDNKVKLGLGIGVVCYGDQNPNGIEEVDVGKKKKKMCGDGGGGGGFTAAQLHELEQQLVIYKHLAAGLPVPFQLLLPIWNSVAASFGSSNAAALFKHYPSFVGFHPLGFDYRNQMDPEPGRCRRTDGKKWRCSKNVVSGQKYCEQHMHRGRQRSRKPVENSEVAPPSTTKAPKNSEGELSNSKTNLQISTPKSLQLLAQSSNNSSVSHGKTTASSAYHECKKNIESVTTTSIGNVPANGTATTPSAVATTPNASSGIHEFKKNIGSIPTTSIAHVPANRTATPTASTAFHECKKNIASIPTTSIANVPANRTATTTSSSGFHECNKNKGSIPTTSIANVPANRTANTPAAVATTITGGPNTATNSSSNENNLNIGVKDNSSNHAGDNCMSRGSSNNRNNINVGSNISTGLGFSPKSVLQGGRIILLGRNGVCFDNRNGGELEPGRCRRTDGKKWRCRRDVLPDQKYCGRHIHRGAKRKLKEFQTVGVPSTSAAAMTSAQLSHTASVPTKTDCAIPNTNLSMSIPASMPLLQHDEKSNSSSDSDTTITDTSLAAYDDSYLSS